MEPTAALSVLLPCGLAYLLYRWYRRPSVSDIPGPEPESFWLGNLRQLLQPEVGNADFDWQERYGGLVHIKGPLGEDRLWVSDPKALQYICQTAGYNFPKLPERRAISKIVVDAGLSWAEGEAHKRQRKAMLPAFGIPEARALFPIFTHCAETITLRWKDSLLNAPDHSSVFNVPYWLSRATLDAVGEAAFDYKFGVMADDDNELIAGYNSILADVLGSPSKKKIFAQSISGILPLPVLDFLYDHLPGPSLERARGNRKIAHKIAKELLQNKSDDLVLGKSSRDVMSVLVKANLSGNEKARLTDHEMRSQMRTILLAGHETTSNTLTWALLELAQHPEMQLQLREEVRAMESTIRARGDTQFTSADLEAMPYTQAVIKEVLRFHPVVPHIFRQSAKDEVLPLSTPLTTKSGKVITEVTIPKGMKFVISITAYNRDKGIWGEDSHLFKPERWLSRQNKRGPSVGVYSNLLTFSAGIRACIGWRFALYETQAFLVELISNFDFAPTEDIKRLKREPCLVMVPVLEGEHEKGAQLPLKVTLATRE